MPSKFNEDLPLEEEAGEEEFYPEITETQKPNLY
jgi:hypothetical protein